MCELCGCTRYIREGKEAVLRRATEIISELGLTPENADDYENTEIISRLISPFGSLEDEVYKAAVWVADLHMGVRKPNRFEERYKAHVRAFQDIFSRLPVKGEPRYIVTTYHQLEQLGWAVNSEDLASVDPRIRETLLAVNQVHEGVEIKEARLRQRYNL